MANGTVLWFNKVKGYGAIASTKGERLHVAGPGLHVEVNPQDLRKGVEVEFEVREGSNGLEAHRVAIAPPAAAPNRARLRRRH
jgi:cold shock CspA family protein